MSLPPCPLSAPCWRLWLALPAPRVLRLPRDFERELACLRSAALRHACAVHAYALLPHRLDLLVSGLLPRSVPALLQALARPGVAMGATTGWRARAGMRVERHDILEAMRAIDQAPVRAGVVAHACAWAWSSHRACSQGASDDLFCPHPAYLDLARNRDDRRRRYRGYDPGTPGCPTPSP